MTHVNFKWIDIQWCRLRPSHFPSTLHLIQLTTKQEVLNVQVILTCDHTVIFGDQLNYLNSDENVKTKTMCSNACNTESLFERNPASCLVINYGMLTFAVHLQFLFYIRFNWAPLLDCISFSNNIHEKITRFWLAESNAVQVLHQCKLHVVLLDMICLKTIGNFLSQWYQVKRW